MDWLLNCTDGLGLIADLVPYLLVWLQGGGRGRGGGGPRALTRPIICICNDAYVPALRPLREVAKVVHLAPPASGKLTDRLKCVRSAGAVLMRSSGYFGASFFPSGRMPFHCRRHLPGHLPRRFILEQEDLQAEPRSLSVLVDRAEGDIRSCIHSLQFMARQGNTRITVKEASSAASTHALLADLGVGPAESDRPQRALSACL